jgi:hypothetical protein
MLTAMRDVEMTEASGVDWPALDTGLPTSLRACQDT